MVSDPLPLVCFVFPYRSVGGVSILFLRLASYLAEAGLARACLVDYKDGFMAQNRDRSVCSLLEYHDDLPVYIPTEAIVVFQSMTPWSIFSSLKIQDSTRVVFWNCHPFNLIPLVPGFRTHMQNNAVLGNLILNSILLPYKIVMKRFVRTLLNHRALVFMDRENRRVTARYLGIKNLPEIFLAIPVDIRSAFPNHSAPSRDLNRDGVRVVWLGRVVDFKFHILNRALERMNALQPELDVPLEVTIIGSGDFLTILQEVAHSLLNIRVQFIEGINLQQIDTYLLENADMVMAMGTSALDAGQLSIPTLLLDYAYQPVDVHYRFTWLHERDGYSLGDQIRPCHLETTADSMLDKIQELIVQNETLRVRVRAYVENYHSLHKIGRCLMTLLLQSDCNWKHLRDARVLGRGTLYSIFARLRTLVSTR